jgi:hypothetical protein
VLYSLTLLLTQSINRLFEHSSRAIKEIATKRQLMH